MKLERSYYAGIWMIVLSFLAIGPAIAMQFSKVVFPVYMLISVVTVVLNIVFLFGFVQVGNKHSSGLKIAAIAFIVIGTLGSIIGWIQVAFQLFARNTLTLQAVVLGVNFFSLFLLLLYAIFAIIFGLGVSDLPVDSSTKKYLKLFSILEGASVLSVIGLIAFPYFAFESYIFKLLFLRDTSRRDHKDKDRRNKLWVAIPLAVYILCIITLATILIVALQSILSVLV